MNGLKLYNGAQCAEGVLYGLIFDSCRANPTRADRTIGQFTVEFSLLQQDKYLAFINGSDGNLIATAYVDKDDT